MKKWFGFVMAMRGCQLVKISLVIGFDSLLILGSFYVESRIRARNSGEIRQ